MLASKQPEPLTETLFMNEALTNLRIRQRLIPTKDGSSPLSYFDSATMNKYKYPSKPAEVLFCRNPVLPESCNEAMIVETLAAKQNSLGRICTPEASSFGLESMINSVHMDVSTIEVAATVELSCGISKCQNSAVLSFKDLHGLKGTTVSSFVGGS